MPVQTKPVPRNPVLALVVIGVVILVIWALVAAGSNVGTGSGGSGTGGAGEPAKSSAWNVTLGIPKVPSGVECRGVSGQNRECYVYFHAVNASGTPQVASGYFYLVADGRVYQATLTELDGLIKPAHQAPVTVNPGDNSGLTIAVFLVPRGAHITKFYEAASSDSGPLFSASMNLTIPS